MEYFKTAGDIRYSNIQKYLRDIGADYNARVKISVEDGRIVMEKEKISYNAANEMATHFYYDNIDALCNYCRSDNCIVVVTRKSGRYKTGIAICKKGDECSLNIGLALALSRAINKPLPKELQEYLGIHQ